MKRSQGGFTLLELMATIAIGFALTGIGVGVYLSFRRSTQIYGEASRIAAVISSARNSALTYRAPAVAAFSVKPGRGPASEMKTDVAYYALTRQPVASWHFETLAQPEAGACFEGSRAYRAYVKNADVDQPDPRTAHGRVGSALRLRVPLANPGADPAYLEVGLEPHYVAALDLRDGVYIEAWVNPTRGLEDGTILPVVSKWDVDGGLAVFALRLAYSLDDDACTLIGEVHTSSTLEGEPLRSASYTQVRPGQWTHVAMAFQLDASSGNRKLTTFINGEEAVDPTSSVERFSEKPIAPSRGPVRIGCIDPAQPSCGWFLGSLDEVSISTFAAGERQRLSGKLGFEIRNLDPTPGGALGEDTTYCIAFDRNGRLAVEPGQGTPRIRLYSMSSAVKRRVRELEVTMLGGVQVSECEERLRRETGQWVQIGGSP